MISIINGDCIMAGTGIDVLEDLQTIIANITVSMVRHNIQKDEIVDVLSQSMADGIDYGIKHPDDAEIEFDEEEEG